MIQTLVRLYHRYPGSSVALVLLLLVENALELLGIAMIVPVLGYLVGQSQGSLLPHFVSQFLEGKSMELVFAMLVLVFIAKSVVQGAGRTWSARFCSKIFKSYQIELSDVVLASKLGQVRAVKEGTLINAVVQEANRASLTYLYSNQWLTAVLSILAYGVLTFSISPLLTITALILGAISFYPLGWINRICERHGSEYTDIQERLQTDLIELAHGFKWIKAHGLEPKLSTRFNDLIEKNRYHWERIYFWSGAMPLFTHPIGIFILSVLIVMGMRMNIEFPKLVAFLISFQRLIPMVSSAQNLKNNFQVTLPGRDRIEALFKDFRNEREEGGKHELSSFAKTVEFKGVSLKFASGQSVLNGIDLKISRGDYVGLIGPSGQGKTTLVDVLLGLYRPTGGGVFVDGTDLSELTLSSWRSQITYVSQEGFFVDDSLRANLLLGVDREVSESELQETLTLAQCGFVKNLPEGVETRMGARASRLSGGERQRIALARALLRRTPIIILDEATSALDNATEATIWSALEEKRKKDGLTLIVIAHRLSTLKNADRILAVEQGKVIEEGSWQSLAANPDSMLSELWKGKAETS